jgi:hypothetical protein
VEDKMEKTKRNWMPKPLKAATILLICAVGVFGTTAQPQPIVAGLAAAPREFKSLLAIPVPMPEPSYPAILTVDLLTVAGLMVIFRRRIASILS